MFDGITDEQITLEEAKTARLSPFSTMMKDLTEKNEEAKMDAKRVEIQRKYNARVRLNDAKASTLDALECAATLGAKVRSSVENRTVSGGSESQGRESASQMVPDLPDSRSRVTIPQANLPDDYEARPTQIVFNG